MMCLYWRQDYTSGGIIQYNNGQVVGSRRPLQMEEERLQSPDTQKED